MRSWWSMLQSLWSCDTTWKSWNSTGKLANKSKTISSQQRHLSLPPCAPHPGDPHHMRPLGPEIAGVSLPFFTGPRLWQNALSINPGGMDCAGVVSSDLRRDYLGSESPFAQKNWTPHTRDSQTWLENPSEKHMMQPSKMGGFIFPQVSRVENSEHIWVATTYSLSLPPPEKIFRVDSESSIKTTKFPRKHHGNAKQLESSDLPRNACDARPLFCVLLADAGSEVLPVLQGEVRTWRSWRSGPGWVGVHGSDRFTIVRNHSVISPIYGTYPTYLDRG